MLQIKGLLRFLRHYTVAVLLLLCYNEAGATHLVGGDMTYKYLRSTSSGEEYEIFVTMYRDCYHSQTAFDPQIEVGVYENTGNRSKVRSIYLNYEGESSVNPPDGGSNCAFQANVCLKGTVYHGIITLDPSPYGYHLQYVRCCRNSSVNIPDNVGQTYYIYIPPTKYKNSSPYFNSVPAPYICADDTVRLSYTASESDGDSLVYSIAEPYAGGDDVDPIPAPPTYFTSIPKAPFKSNYSYSSPFGPMGVAKVDKNTGITTVYAPGSGLYIMAIDVQEYRNGVLINTTRRDIQIIVLPCPKNPPPKAQSGSALSSGKPFYVTAGEPLDFSIDVEDGDDIVMEYSGAIFDPQSDINPKASISNNTVSKIIHAKFHWETACSLARSQPYTFNIKVTDKGCPPKTSYFAVSIYVQPFKGTDFINGPTNVCRGKSGTYYFGVPKTGNSGSHLHWEAVGGKLISPNDQNSVWIEWTAASKGQVKMVEVSKNGCPGDTAYKDVTINPEPQTSPIAGQNIICVNNTASYSITNTPGSSYTWLIKGGKKLSGGNSNAISVEWQLADSAGEVAVVEQNKIGCLGDTMRLKVYVGAPMIDSIYGSLSVCPNASGIDYWVTPQKGSTYYWNITGGTQAAGGNGPNIKVDWSEQGGGTISVVEITKDGCRSDTLKLDVLKDYVLYTSRIRGDTALCEFTKNKSYEVTYSNGSSYDWKISKGTILSGQGTAKVVVDWDNAGKGVLSVTETAYDPINNKPCIGIPVATIVSIYPLPNTSAIAGPKEVCEYTTFTYRVKGFDSSRYIWKINADIVADSTYADSVVYTFPKILGVDSVFFQVLEISRHGCISSDRSLYVKVHPVPVTSGITGPDIICAPDLNGAAYSVKGFPTSIYQWKVDGGSIVAGNGSPQVTVNWEKAGLRRLYVKEFSDFGCEGDTMAMDVKVDSMQLIMDLVTTAWENDKEIELYWNTQHTEFFNGYIKIFRAYENQEYYKLIDSVPAGTTYYRDSKVETDKHAYYYRIGASNSCGKSVFSDIHRSILLRGYKNMPGDTNVRIFWNEYEGWDTQDYDLYKGLNEDPELFFIRVNTDTAANMPAGLDGYKQCYRVAAVKNNGRHDTVSVSNTYCFFFEPVLYIPNAFTPGGLNGDGLNDFFKVFAANYKAFEIVIYNRWGERVFASSDPAIQWDGTYHGQPCPQDVYLYMVQVRGVGNNLYRKGSLHLIRW